MLTFSGYSPQEVEIHDAVTPKDQVRILLDWISSRAIDVLSTGDLNQLQLYHLLANPYHGSTLEEGMSRACLISYPGYPKLLAIVGPTGQQQPSFDALVIHTKNSVHLAYGLGIPKPKIALLSAIDAVTFEDLHTYNCRCLVAMSKNQQISGVELDGPMNLDTAIAPRSIKRAGLESAVTGQADVLIVDSHQTRSVLALTLEYFRDADLARIILGGRVPLTLFPHINQEKSILGSLAVALHVSRYLSAAQTFNWDTHIDPLDYVW